MKIYNEDDLVPGFAYEFIRPNSHYKLAIVLSESNIELANTNRKDYKLMIYFDKDWIPWYRETSIQIILWDLNEGVTKEWCLPSYEKKLI